MAEQSDDTRAELLSRIELIESMMQEGRRVFEYWGWTQVLWGAAYLIAIAWSYWSGRPDIAWPVTMIAATVITITVSRSRRRSHPASTVTRSLQAIWISVGSALFLYGFAVALSGHGELHGYIAAIETLLGAANVASGLILRWRVQTAVGLLWWAAAVATCFVAESLIIPVLVAATLVCLIGFGFYLMYCERRDRRKGALHA